jgi:hypothetical protein
MSEQAAEQIPPTYPFPPGTPDVVPADFEEAGIQREASALALTPEEIAEFRALRAEKKARDEQVAQDAAEAAARLQPARHHVHLADGTVTEGSTIESHVDNGSGPVPVTGAYLKAEHVAFVI